MAPRLLILADDFTGALDTGVRLALAGVGTRVAAHWDSARRMAHYDEPVLVVDTESRHLRPAAAAKRVGTCVRSAAAEGTSLYYKKTDSTLRGNVGAELSALLSASGEDHLFFIPALPAAGRTTVGGVVLVDGVPLHRTSFARDPLDPTTESVVSAIIGAQSNLRVDNVPRGSDFQSPEGHEKRIVVFDAETDADLQDIGRRIRSAGIPRAIAGCSGFASVLPGLMDLPRSPLPAVSLGPPMLVVCGSLHEMSLAQVRQAEQAGTASFVAAGHRGEAHRDLAGLIALSLESAGTAIVKTTASGGGRNTRRRITDCSGRSVSRAVGALVREVLSLVQLSTLVIFGGDTAMGVVDALGIRSFFPVRELSQGVVVSRAELDGRDLRLVTKAGGFGAPDVLARIRDAFHKEL